MRWLLPLLAMCVLASAEASPPADLDQGDPPIPGRETPVAAAPRVALRFAWDDYRSVVVVGDGVGVTRPAWVGTWNKTTGGIEVVYRAVCFLDGRGRLHVDARHSLCIGPNSRGWSPDSFAFGRTRMWTQDDRESAHEGKTGETIPADTQADEYRTLLRKLQALVEGGS